LELQERNKLELRGQMGVRAVVRTTRAGLRIFGECLLQFWSLFRGGAIGSTWAFGA
jgi:hypothetical protein